MAVKEKWIKTKPIDLSLEEIQNLIEIELKRYSSILIAYLFGSSVKGGFSYKSDIDLAIYTSSEFTWEDFYSIYGELTKKLHSDRLDLVWLNKADPILSFEIIKTGRVLFLRDPDILNDFELKVKKNYYDYVLYLKKHRSFRESGL